MNLNLLQYLSQQGQTPGINPLAQRQMAPPLWAQAKQQQMAQKKRPSTGLAAMFAPENRQALIGLGAGLLQGSAESTVPGQGTFGAGLAQGAQNYGRQQNYQQEQQFRQQQAEQAQANADRSFGLQEQRVGLEQQRMNAQPPAPKDQQLLEWAMSLPEGDPRRKAVFNKFDKSKGPLVQNYVGGQGGPLQNILTGQEAMTMRPTLEGKLDPEAVYSATKDGGLKKVKDNDIGAEGAGRLAMLQSARSVIPAIKGLFYKEDGSVNDKNILTAQSVAGFDGIPWTEGRTLRSMWEQGIQGITRIETGAAMPADEVENTRTRFFPKPWDSPELKVAKLTLMEKFLDGTVNLVKPEGDAAAFNVEEFDRELAKELKRVNASKKTASPDSIDTQTINGKTYKKVNGQWMQE